MSPRDHRPGDDPQPDPTVSRLYRELPDVAPSADTDALIRAAARRAVHAGPVPRRGFVTTHWRGLGSAAAALLLGVALTVQWRTQDPARLDEALATAPAAAPASKKAADASIDALFADDATPGNATAAPEATAPATTVASRGALRPGAATTAPTGAATSRAANAAGETAAAATAKKMETIAGAGAPMPPAPAAEAATPAPAAQQQMPAPTLADAAPPAPTLAQDRVAPPAAPAPVPMEKHVAGAPPTPLPPPAASAANSARPEQSAREEDRTEPAEARRAARASADRLAAPAAVAPAPDYRRALAAGRYADALDLLAAPATADARMDRELLRQWLQPGTPPACARLPATDASALLCEGLLRRAAGDAPTPAWRARIEAAGLSSGDHAYRRGLVEKLFGPAPPP